MRLSEEICGTKEEASLLVLLLLLLLLLLEESPQSSMQQEWPAIRTDLAAEELWVKPRRARDEG